MQVLAVLLAVVLGASAAQAVVLSPGDIVTAGGGMVTRVDPTTGDRTIVSCTDIAVCPGGLVGSGPGIIFNGIAFEADASLVVPGFVNGVGVDFVLLRIDPATGDRAVISGPAV